MIPRVGGVKLILAPAGNAHEITSIPVVAASLAIATVALIFGIIIGILQLITMAAAGDADWRIEVLIHDIIEILHRSIHYGCNYNHNLQLPCTKNWRSSVRT